MCTRIDKEATKKMRSKLNKEGTNYAWKIVLVKKDGSYESPIQYYPFKMTGYNRDRVPPYVDPKHRVWQGVFHMFRTRKIARIILKLLRAEQRYWETNLKIVKIAYRARDFYVIGDSDHWSLEFQRELDKLPLDSICVKAFKFVN